MTIAPGLCSITFRSLPADEVVRVAVRAGVAGIEWGADLHAPPGGGPALEALGNRTRDAGLEVVSYGSYLGMAPPQTANDGSEIDAVLDTADALGAPMVRIWTEFGVTPSSPSAERQRVVERTADIGGRIFERGLVPTLEFHPGTLTDDARSTNELLDAVGCDALRTHWQPDPSLSAERALDELAMVAPRLAHLHVFAWGPAGIEDRRPLADGARLWAAAVARADRDAPPVARGRYALCEYVRDDDPEQFMTDARTLRAWIDDIDQGRH